MKRLFILFFLVSCGEPSKDCISGEEAVLRCKAEAVSKYYPGSTPDYEYDFCQARYPVSNTCY